MASSRWACSPANGITHIRACAMDRSFRQTTHIRACAMDRSRKLFRLFSRHISGTQSFWENRHINIDLLVVHNPLVPLIGCLVACSARTRADRQTDRQNDYRNPRCACAPRVNYTLCTYLQTYVLYRYRWQTFINPNYYGFSASAFLLLKDFETTCERQENVTEFECYPESGDYILRRFDFDKINPYYNITVSETFELISLYIPV